MSSTMAQDYSKPNCEFLINLSESLSKASIAIDGYQKFKMGGSFVPLNSLDKRSK